MSKCRKGAGEGIPAQSLPGNDCTPPSGRLEPGWGASMGSDVRPLYVPRAATREHRQQSGLATE